MTQGLFQKELNDEISVRDHRIDNPQPAALEMRVSGEIMIFSARPGYVLKSIYSSLDSLDAFSSDDSCQLYMLYSREEGAANAVFIQHDQTPSEENVTLLSFWDLNAEQQSYIPHTR